MKRWKSNRNCTSLWIRRNSCLCRTDRCRCWNCFRQGNSGPLRSCWSPMMNLWCQRTQTERNCNHTKRHIKKYIIMIQSVMNCQSQSITWLDWWHSVKKSASAFICCAVTLYPTAREYQRGSAQWTTFIGDSHSCKMEVWNLHKQLKLNYHS